MPIQITAKKDGFRRAGVAHPAVMTEYADDDFTTEQLAQLKAEPMLTINIIKAPKKDNRSKDAASEPKLEPTPDPAAAVDKAEEKDVQEDVNAGTDTATDNTDGA